MDGLISKLCLGTVQLGLKYGIKSQRDGKPPKSESIDLLRTAYDLGIRYFDTAEVYGDAEVLLRESGVTKKPGVKVVTKIDGSVTKNLQRAVNGSLKNLGIDMVDGVLLHDAAYYYDENERNELIELKESGVVSNIGVSVYEPDEALQIVIDGLVDYIQIPYNVLDQRLDQTDFFIIAKENGIKVFAQSVFLQGLLLFEEDEIPERFMDIKPYLKLYDSITADFGFNKMEAALLFAISNRGIDQVVFGIDDERQLMDNIRILDRFGDFEKYREQFVGISEGIREVYLNPGRWEELR